jgi:YbbR domain-containing protein
VTFEEGLQSLKGWLRTIFLDDWVTKTIALLITLIIWYGVTGNRAPTTRRMSVNLVLNRPTETEFANEVRNKVDITVTGDKNRVSRIVESEMIVTADLTSAKPGELVVQLNPDTVNIELPTGVRLEEIEPNRIPVKLEPRIEKLVEVRPEFSGRLPEGYEIYSHTVIPSQIRLRGAASTVNALDGVPTEKIDLNIRTEDFVERQITVNLFDPKITVLDAVVDVAVRVGEERKEKSFGGVPVSDPNGAKAMPETASVTLFGAHTIIDNLRPEDIQITLDTGADGAITPRVVLPPEAQEKIQVRAIRPSGFSIVK